MSGSYLSEHQAPTASRDMGYAPADDPLSLDETQRKTVKLVQRLFEEAKKHRAKYDHKWLEYYKMFRGKQWFDIAPSYRHREVINLIFQNIQSMAPIQTDARPKLNFIPRSPEDLPFAEILGKVSSSDWERNCWLQQLTAVIYDGYFYGAGMSSLDYDVSLDYGAGGICYRRRDPFHCYPDPDAENVNLEARYFIYAEPVATVKLKAIYPDYADRIKPDLFDLGEEPDRTDLRDVRYQSPTDKHSNLIDSRQGDRSLEHGKTLKITCYVKDEETVEEPEDKEHPDGPQVQKLKYPHGRKIVLVNNIPVEDAAMPYDDGKFPFQRLLNYMLPGEFWGISEVENLAAPQKIFNKLVSYTLDVLTLMGNPIWLVDTSANIDTDMLFNRPGLIVEKEPGSEVQRLPGVELQPYVLQLIDRLKGYFDDVGGNNDITRGVNPTGVTAARAIEALQDSAYTRQRQKARQLDGYLQELGQQYVSRVMQFYTTPRVFRITNDNRSQQYFRMHVDPSGEKPQAIITPYTEGQNGQMYEGETQKYEIQGEFDVEITTGSTLPIAKADKEDQLFQLFDRGIIDAEEVLKGLDYPNKEEVLQRLQQRQDAQAAAQQQPKVKGAA